MKFPRQFVRMLLFAFASAMGADAAEVTFPAGTLVTAVYAPSYFQVVERDEFRFYKQLGGLSINAANYDGNHPSGGGLFVGIMGLETTVRMERVDGQPFSLEGVTILERNSPSGLALTLGAKPHGSAPGDSIEEEFAFDRNTSTYDTFDVLAVNDRFASVDYVTFVSVESPFVDPSATNYVIDRLMTAASGPVVPAVSADFNDDNTVDHYDLEAWTDNFGAAAATFTQGDADGDLLVGGADSLIWQRQFDGEIDMPATSIPEPSAFAISVACVVVTVRVGRNRLPGKIA